MLVGACAGVMRRYCAAAGQLRLVKRLEKRLEPGAEGGPGLVQVLAETRTALRVEAADPLASGNEQGHTLAVALYTARPHPDSDPNSGSGSISVKQGPQRVEVVATPPGPDGSDAFPSSLCVITAPAHCSFRIRTSGDSPLTVRNLHADRCHLRTETGQILIENLKARSVKAHSAGGTISCCGTVTAGEIDLKTDSEADVVCEHMRANDLKISTEKGNVSAESCYSDRSSFATILGSLKLGNVHRHCKVEILERGDLTVTGFDGTLEAILKRGNVHLQASRLTGKNSIFVHESGLVDVMLSDMVGDMSLIELIAKKLNVAPELLNLGRTLEDSQYGKYRYENAEKENAGELYVECRNGAVELKTSSWEQMLKNKGIDFDK